MTLKVDYVVKETGINLWRNLTLTLATMITLAITLIFVGAGLLMRAGVNNANVQWQGNTEFIVYMQPDATEPQIEAVRGDLEENPQVESLTYLDHEAAYEEFLELFEDSPDLTENVTPDILPTSFKVVPVRADDEVVLALSEQFETKAGVREVVAAPEEIKKMENLFGKMTAGAVVLAVGLGVAALVLIANTIRTAMFARRREIEVMKLVGATNWFIRVPFMLEGLVQGIVGAGVGIAGLVFLRYAFDTWVASTVDFLSNFRVDARDMTIASVWVLVAGCVVGVLGSAFAVRRFLDV
jgi:cell division transport system permease protein